MTNQKELKNLAFEAIAESSNQAQININNQSLTKRVNSLLEMVPSEEQLNNDGGVKKYFLEEQEKQEALKKELEKFKKTDFTEKEVKRLEETLTTEEIKEIFGSEINKYTYGKRIFADAFCKSIPIINLVHRNIGEVVKEKELESQIKKLEKVKELALDENNSQGEVKKFINMVGSELTNIRDELDKREKDHTKEKESYKKELENKFQEIENLRIEGEGIVNTIKSEKNEEIAKLEEKLTEAKNAAGELKEQLKEREKQEAEKKEQQKKLLETQNQLHSPDKVDLEALKIKHSKLEQEAKTTGDKMVFWAEKIADYKLALIQLKEEREREEQEKGRFLALYINETDLHSITKDKILGNQVEISTLKIELNAERKEVENQKAARELQVKNLKSTHQAQNKLRDKKEKDWQEAYLTWKAENDEQHEQIKVLRTEKTKEQNKNTDLNTLKEKNERKINQLETEKADQEKTINDLTQEKNQLQEQLTEKEKEVKKAKQKARLGALGNVVQGALDYIPGIPDAWKSLGKGSIQAGAIASIIYDLPNWGYEAIIILFGLACWYALKNIYHRIFGRKERNHLQELRGELQEARSKVLMLKEENREAAEKAKQERETQDQKPKKAPVNSPSKKEPEPAEIKTETNEPPATKKKESG